MIGHAPVQITHDAIFNQTILGAKPQLDVADFAMKEDRR